MEEKKNTPRLRFPEFTDDWEQRKLSEILYRRIEQRQQSEEYPRLAFASGQGVIPLSERKTNNREQLTKDEFTKKYLVTEIDDIVYNPANVKYGAIDRNKCGRGLISPIYVTFTTSEIPGFIERIVKSYDFQQRALKFEEGTVTKRQSVNPEDLLTLQILIAPQQEEQRKIGAYFDNLDTLITLSERKVELLEKQKKAVMKKIFSQEVRFKKPDGSDFPEWEEKMLGDVCECLDKYRKPISKDKRVSGPYPYYGSTNVQDYVENYLFDEPLVLLAEDAGPFMDYMNKPIAQWAEGKFWVNNHAHVLRPKEHRKFMFYSLEHKDIRTYINNPERGKLNQEEMVKIPIMMPHPDEQTLIADFFTSFDEAIAAAREELAKWNELKKGLFQQMFI